MEPRGDPLSTIGEAEATGHIADLYDDIRKTRRMSFVIFVWRRLASIPGRLAWTWPTMKPLYANGAGYSEADALRAAANLLPVPRFSTAALRSHATGHVIPVEPAASDAARWSLK